MSIIKKPAEPPKSSRSKSRLNNPFSTHSTVTRNYRDEPGAHRPSALRLVFKKDYDFKRWLRSQNFI